MKFYLYVSDAKVDMLLAQLPHGTKQKIATEFKIDLKLLSASRRTENEEAPDRFAKLEAVVSFLREYGNLGTVDGPDEYIADELPMRWGPYSQAFEADNPPLVYFGGVTERTVLGLGGSTKHVIGNVGDGSFYSASATPYLVRYLCKQLGEPFQQGPPQCYDAGWGLRDPEDMSLSAVYLATLQMSGPLQRLEFMAKRLLLGPSPMPHLDGGQARFVLLGTPLYVAMAE